MLIDPAGVHSLLVQRSTFMSVRPFDLLRSIFSAVVFSLVVLFFVNSTASATAQDLFNGAKASASMGVGGADLSSPHGALGAVSSGNPAGLASIEGRSLEVSGVAVLAHGHYTSPYSTDGTLNPLLGVAPSAAFATDLGKSLWRVSVSATPDVSLSATWYYDDAPGTAGVTYGYQRNQSSLLNERFAVGAGHPLGRKVEVGATVGLVYDSSTLVAPTIFQQQPVLEGLKTLLTLKTSGVGWNGTAGLIYSPVSRLQFGISYKSSTAIHGTGTADGNLSALLAALGLTGSFRPDFHYSAALNNTLPQSGGIGVTWKATPRTRVFLRGDLVNWSDSFNHLALRVSNGDNADLNGLVGSNGFHDVIPLDWHNQGIFHAGVEIAATSKLSLRGGYVVGNDPVPSSTLTPLTAAITRQSLAAGVGYRSGRYKIDAGYQAGLPETASVGQSILRAGEYDNSQTELSTQSLSTTLSIVF
jgi:long-subunit fatty acid transport protein